MAGLSGIEWTEATWNPVTGCTKISPGCKHCYAERMAKRLQRMGQANYANGFQLTRQPQTLETPLRWKKPKLIFVNSMSDLFHRDVPSEYIRQTFDVMRRAHWHQFQVLTKRAGRLERIASQLDWAPNIWMGVSVENERYRSRIDALRQTSACLKFLSLEPLLGPLPRLNLQGIDWVIVGGESGPKSRPMDPRWANDLRRQCQKARVPFFFKQWGGRNKKKAGRELDGRTWDEMPEIRMRASKFVPSSLGFLTEEMDMARAKVTGRKAAKAASRTLRSRSTGRSSKTSAGSARSQRTRTIKRPANPPDSFTEEELHAVLDKFYSSKR